MGLPWGLHMAEWKTEYQDLNIEYSWNVSDAQLWASHLLHFLSCGDLAVGWGIKIPKPHWDFLPVTYRESSWSSQIWPGVLFGECKPYPLLPSRSLGWASFLHRFLWGICITSNSGHAAEGEKEGEKAVPTFLGSAEEIPVKKANTLLIVPSFSA